MKKILLALGTFLVLTTVGFANQSFAANKASLYTVTDKDNQEWCKFMFIISQEDSILKEHKEVLQGHTDEWLLCSAYGITTTDSQIREQYKMETPTGYVDLKGRTICIGEGQEIPCSKKLEDKITKPLCTESAEVEDGLKVLLKFKYYSRMMFS